MLLARIICIAALCLCPLSSAQVFPNWAARNELIYYHSSSSSIGVKIGNRTSESFKIQGMDGWYGWKVFADAAEGVQSIKEADSLFNTEIVVFDNHVLAKDMLIAESKTGDLNKLINILRSIVMESYEFKSDALRVISSQWSKKGFGLDPVFLSNELITALEDRRQIYEFKDAARSRVCGSNIYSVAPDKTIFGALIWFSREIIANEGLLLHVDPSDGMHPPAMQGQLGALSPVPYKVGEPTRNNFYAMSTTGLYRESGVRNTKLTGKGVDIYVIDTTDGLSDRFIRMNVRYYDPTGIGQVVGHGAVVGQIIDNKIWGVAPNANIIYKNACNEEGRCSPLLVIDGICSALAAGKTSIVNLSLGTPIPLSMLRIVLEDAARSGILISASYGNRSVLSMDVNGTERSCEKIKYYEDCSHFPADWSKNSYNTIFKPINGLYSVAGWDIYEKNFAAYNRHNAGKIIGAPILSPGEFWSRDGNGDGIVGREYPFYGSSFASPVWTGVMALWLECKDGRGYPVFPSNFNKNFNDWLKSQNC